MIWLKAALFGFAAFFAIVALAPGGREHQNVSSVIAGVVGVLVAVAVGLPS